MTTYAIITNNVVQNLVEWDGISISVIAQGALQVPVPVGVAVSPGWFWNNGTPINPNPPPALPPPIDLSNFDNLDKVFKAFGLVLRDYTNGLQAGTYTNKTINQMKADFLTKYISLP